MNTQENLWIDPYSRIKITQINILSVRAELCLWPAGTTGISAIGADRHEAFQRLEKKVRGLADAVSGTFTHEICTDE